MDDDTKSRPIKKPIRVLMVLENCPYEHDARVPNVATALKSAGFSVSVVAPAGRRFCWYRVVNEIHVYEFPAWPFSWGTIGYIAEFLYSSLAIALLSVWVLLQQGFDIIHVSNPPDCLVPILSIYKMNGTRIIYDQHDLSPELYAAKFKDPRPSLSKGLMWLERLSYRLANYVIVTNESVRKIATRRGGMEDSKVTIVRNGPPTRDLSSLAVDPVVRSKASNVIAFAGVTGTQDGLDQLCRALHYLLSVLECDDFYCIVIGDGDALQEAKQLAADLGLTEKIWFAGWISDPDVYLRYMFSADICVSPEPSNDYNDRSTFIKIMEYMAMGKPIVAYDLYETRWSAQGAALYAPAGEVDSFARALSVLMKDVNLRRSMGEAGRERAERNLAWQYSVPNLLHAYKEVITPAKSNGTNGGLNCLGAKVS